MLAQCRPLVFGHRSPNLRNVEQAILYPGGKSPGDIEALFASDLDGFRAKRAKYLLYSR